jgi:hypothetical protein
MVGLLVALAAATIVVFIAFDRNSHSVSDTLRPFVLTMGPAWIVGLAAARSILRIGQARSDDLDGS